MTSLRKWTFRVSVLVVLALASASRPSNATEPPVIRIVAKKFSYAPAEVRLQKGVTVVLELVSEDRVHGFNLPELGVRTDVTPGKPARVTLTPAKAGRFEFHCDVFCGDGHGEMTGAIVVTE